MVQRALKEAGFWVILGVNKAHIRAFSLHPTCTAVVYCKKGDGSRSVAISVDWGTPSCEYARLGRAYQPDRGMSMATGDKSGV